VTSAIARNVTRAGASAAADQTGDVVEIRTAVDEDWRAISRVDTQSFGYTMTPEEEDRGRSIMDLSRFRVAVDGGEVVGVAGSYELTMTMPGGQLLPTGGVTWVSVAVTHRRQGIMTGLLDAVHDDVRARGEPLAALTASEGGIYERRGYGIASRRRVTSIDRRAARVQDRFAAPLGAVRIVDRVASRPRLMELWDRYRVTRAGEIDRPEQWWAVDEAERPHLVHAVHDDGFASWRTEPAWHDGHPRHELFVTTMAAITPEAHLALWSTVLALDLVGTITSTAVAPDDPLPFLLTNPRVVRTTDLNDGVWCRPLDVAACFRARAYGTDADVIVEADGARWRIGAAGVAKVRSRPDLVTDLAGLGALLLGGVAPTTLAAGRRLEARDAQALCRADAVFRISPDPYLQTGF
jgi:predicted acetyltransferase